MFIPLLAFLTLTILAYLGVDWIRRLAIRRHIIDHPNERSSHSVPTPRGGGLAIVVLVIGTVLVFGLVNGFDRQSLVYVVAGILLAWLGWQDDVRTLSPKVRFPLQAIAVIVAMLGMGYFKSVTIPLFGELQLGWVGIPVTFFWILGLINAYNFMDGLDGFAGGVALAAGLGWMVLSSSFGGLENPARVLDRPCPSPRAVSAFWDTTGRPRVFSWAMWPARFWDSVSPSCRCCLPNRVATR